MNLNFRTIKYLDWPLAIMYLVLVLIGWVSIFAAVYDPEHASIIDTTQRYGLQMIWILGAWGLAVFILFVNPKAWPVLAWLIYALGIVLLIAVLVIGAEHKGSKSWIGLGPINIQPAEFMKIALSLALSKLMSKHDFHLKSFKSYLQTAAVILLPIGLILLENETGLALVLISVFLMLFREGLPGWILLFGLLAIGIFLLSILFPLQWVIFAVISLCMAGYILISRDLWWPWFYYALFCLVHFLIPRLFLQSDPAKAPLLPIENTRWLKILEQPYWILAAAAPLAIVLAWRALHKKNNRLKIVLLFLIGSIVFTFSVDYIFDNVLEQHQQVRIKNLMGLEEDIYGAGYNVHQSKVAIGSGGFFGKGFLKGTQTKYNFVPEQSTDFIFCTIGEEWGFLGSAFVILFYLIFILRIIHIAERQDDAFVRIYGYCVASFFFFHFFINIGMTIGIMPVIGIPLPFVSYGGSSLWSFTILLFILLKMDTCRR